MQDLIAAADVPQERPLRWLVPAPHTWKNYTCCPWAKSILVIDPETEGLVLCPVTCKRWGCPFCAKNKIRKLAYLTNGAEPNRWIRLGVDPSLYSSPKEAWEKTSNSLPEAARQIRKEGKECEYLRVTELHKSGFPHYHALLRSSYIPQKMLSDIWARLTAAPVVWIAKIDSSFSSFRYLVKYLTKLHKIEWTDRHVSYSRKFFREEDKEKMAYPERCIEEKTDEHPWLYLARRYARETVGVDERGNFHLPDSFCGTPYQFTREDVGLPRMPEQVVEPEKPKVQTTLMNDLDQEDYTDNSF